MSSIGNRISQTYSFFEFLSKCSFLSVNMKSYEIMLIPLTLNELTLKCEELPHRKTKLL